MAPRRRRRKRKSGQGKPWQRKVWRTGSQVRIRQSYHERGIGDQPHVVLINECYILYSYRISYALTDYQASSPSERCGTRATRNGWRRGERVLGAWRNVRAARRIRGARAVRLGANSDKHTHQATVI
jgi:hypothetical protein